MKKLMRSLSMVFTLLAVSGFVVSNFLIAQDRNQNQISLLSTKDPVIDIRAEINVTDEQLADRVNTKIKDFLFYGVYDYVTADVTDGIVILKGWTHEAWIADVLSENLSQLVGVKKIDNKIQQAFGSEDLARRAVRAIYSDAMFEKYSFGSDPPIHVVVNNNTLILAGTVSNAAERERAAYLVDFETNALTVYNQLLLGK